MKQDNRQTQLILCLFGILPVAWLGLLIAPAVSGGLPEIITAFPAAMNDPFHIVLCEDSLKTVLIALSGYHQIRSAGYAAGRETVLPMFR